MKGKRLSTLRQREVGPAIASLAPDDRTDDKSDPVSAPWIGWIQRIWAVALAVPLAAHAYVGWFSRYTGDDYCTAGVVGSQGFLGAQGYWYTTFSARYSFTAVVSAFELVGSWTPQVLPALAMFAWVAAGTWAVLPVARQQRWPHSRLAALVVAELITFATLTAAPNVGQSLYWETGLLTYTLPLILGTLLAGWFARRVLAADTRVTGATMAVSGVAAFVIGGLSETSLMVQTVGLSIGLVLGLAVLRGPRRSVVVGLLGPALLGSLLAGGVMALAPGTRFRASGEQYPQINLARALVAVRASFTLGVWIVRRLEVLSRMPLAFLLLACGALGFTAGQATRGSSAGWRKRLVLIVAVALLGYVLESLSLFPIYLVEGFDPPGRVQLVSDFVLVIALGISAYWSGGLLRQAVRRWTLDARLARQVSMVVLGLVALVPLAESLNTFGQVPVESAYAAAWDGDDQALRSARAISPALVVVAPLPPRWGWAFVDTQADAFPNGCVARYYGVSQVLASGPAPIWTGAPEKGGRPPGL